MEQLIDLTHGWKLNISNVDYIIVCLILSLIVRLILTIFKAIAVIKGDYKDFNTKSFKEAYLKCFFGFQTNDERVNDYFFNMIIGFAELVTYPLLIFLNYPLVIGGWIALKTAGQWGFWEKNRTTFNRYLVGNIIVIAMSFIWLLRYFERVI